MNIIKKSLKRVNFSMIIFFLITCIAIYNIPISLSQEQQSITTRIDINKESEENKLVKQNDKSVEQQITARYDKDFKNQLNNLSDKNNEIKAIIKFENVNSKNETFWSKLIDNPAFWSFLTLLISSIFVPIITYFINDKLNSRKTLLEAKKYKYEKRLNAYLDTMKNAKKLIEDNNFSILTITTLYSEVYIIGSDNTKKLIDESHNLIREYTSNKDQTTFNKLLLKLGEIDNSLRDDLKYIEKTIFD